MKQLEIVFKALADKNRLRILKLLEHKKMCVCELASVLGITQPSTSRHLKKLKNSGLIEGEQQGFWTDYYIGRSGTRYAKALKASMRKWLDRDPLVKQDLEKARHVNRSKLCCRK